MELPALTSIGVFHPEHRRLQRRSLRLDLKAVIHETVNEATATVVWLR